MNDHVHPVFRSILNSHVVSGVADRREKGTNMEDDINKIARRLLDYHPGFLPSGCKGDGFVTGDDKQPFFSESYLYNLLGKEEARTLLALMRPIWRLAEIPDREQP